MRGSSAGVSTAHAWQRWWSPSEVVRSYFRYLGSETIQQTRWPGCVRLGRLGRTEGGGVGILHGLSAASLRSEHSHGGREREDVGWGGLLNLGQGGKNNCSAFFVGT